MSCCFLCSAIVYHADAGCGQVRKRVNALDNLMTSKAVDALINYETVKLFTNEGLEVHRPLMGLNPEADCQLLVLLWACLLNEPHGDGICPTTDCQPSNCLSLNPRGWAAYVWHKHLCLYWGRQGLCHGEKLPTRLLDIC